MNKRHELEIELRGQQVVIEFVITAPDRDVGIMGYGFEDETITDIDGNPLPWELTAAEQEIVGEKVHRMCMDTGSDDY